MSRAIEYKGKGSNAKMLPGVTGIENADGTLIVSATQGATVADSAVQVLTGSDTVDIAKVTADILSVSDAVNALIARLVAAGTIASS